MLQRMVSLYIVSYYVIDVIVWYRNLIPLYYPSCSQSDLQSQKVTTTLSTGYNYDPIDVKIARKKLLVRRLRSIILTTGKRSDGRGVEEVRPISIDTSLLPGAHGSSLFTRGETQSLSTATLGTCVFHIFHVFRPTLSDSQGGQRSNIVQHRRPLKFIYRSNRHPPFLLHLLYQTNIRIRNIRIASSYRICTPYHMPLPCYILKLVPLNLLHVPTHTHTHTHTFLSLSLSPHLSPSSTPFLSQPHYSPFPRNHSQARRRWKLDSRIWTS